MDCLLQNMRVGIDIGTSNSCCYIYTNDGDLEVVLSQTGTRTIPSTVGFTSKNVLIGMPAQQQQMCNPDNTITEFKRIVGRRYTDKQLWKYAKNWPMSLTQVGDDGVGFRVKHLGSNRIVTSSELYTILIKHLLENATRQCGDKITHVVATVPAHFDHLQRDCVRCCLVDLAPDAEVSLLNEPTAAALAYLNRKKSAVGDKCTMLIFDTGAGTLDITALRREGVNFQILGNVGRDAMGGSVFDDLILDRFIKHAKTTKRRNLRDDSKLLAEAKMKAEVLKCVLSTADEAAMEVSNIVMTLTKSEFNAMIAPEVRKMSQTVWDLLSDLNLEPEDIDLVVMVGGGSRVPALSAMLGAMFNNIRSDININECVAMGAALYQRTANGQDNTENDMELSSGPKAVSPQLTIVDVVPVALGIKTKGNRFSIIIAKNTPLPAVHKQIFYPYSRKQNFANIQIYQGIVTQDPQIIDETFVLIDSLVLTGIQKNRPQIIIEFRVNYDGMLEINATSEGTSITGKTIVSALKTNVDNTKDSESKSESE